MQQQQQQRMLKKRTEKRSKIYLEGKLDEKINSKNFDVSHK
jgi:hypothetical protein